MIWTMLCLVIMSFNKKSNPKFLPFFIFGVLETILWINIF